MTIFDHFFVNFGTVNFATSSECECSSEFVYTSETFWLEPGPSCRREARKCEICESVYAYSKFVSINKIITMLREFDYKINERTNERGADEGKCIFQTTPLRLINQPRGMRYRTESRKVNLLRNAQSGRNRTTRVNKARRYSRYDLTRRTMGILFGSISPSIEVFWKYPKHSGSLIVPNTYMTCYGNGAPEGA